MRHERKRGGARGALNKAVEHERKKEKGEKNSKHREQVCRVGGASGGGGIGRGGERVWVPKGEGEACHEGGIGKVILKNYARGLKCGKASGQGGKTRKRGRGRTLQPDNRSSRRESKKNKRRMK